MKYEYVEHDLHAAAFLVCQHHALVGLERIGTTRYSFRFLDDGGVEKDALSFRAGALVEARAYAEALRQCKNFLYSQKTADKRSQSEKDASYASRKAL